MKLRSLSRSALPPLLLAAAFAALLLFPREVSAAVSDGLSLSAHVLIPSLFPFFLCVNLSSALGLTASLARIFAPLVRRLFHVSPAGASALVFGALGGYPVGAQSVADLFQRGQLSRPEAESLLLFCNNTGPAFLFGVLGAVFGCSLPCLALLWGIQLLSALLVGLLHRPSALPPAQPIPMPAPLPFFDAFLAAVRSAGQSLFQITLFVTAFALLKSFLALALPFAPPLLLALLTGVLELSSGVSALGGLSLPLHTVLPLVSFLLAFGGLCVFAQSRAVLAPSGLAGQRMLRAKFQQSLLAAGLTAAACSFLFPSTPAGGLPGVCRGCAAVCLTLLPGLCRASRRGCAAGHCPASPAKMP